MSFEDIHVDDFGWTAEITLKQDDVAIDISSYTTKQFLLEDPRGNVATKTAVFDTDGTDGVLTYLTVDGDIYAAGEWKIQARISKTNYTHTAEAIEFTVAERVD